MKTPEASAATPASTGGIVEQIRRRVSYHRQKLDELARAVDKEMQQPMRERKIGVLLLLRREQSRHDSIVKELEALLR